VGVHHTNARANTKADANPDPNANADPHSHANANSHADPHSRANANSHADPHSSADAHSHADPHSSASLRDMLPDCKQDRTDLRGLRRDRLHAIRVCVSRYPTLGIAIQPAQESNLVPASPDRVLHGKTHSHVRHQSLEWWDRLDRSLLLVPWQNERLPPCGGRRFCHRGCKRPSPRLSARD
jgi:hypothetical protein